MANNKRTTQKAKAQTQNESALPTAKVTPTEDPNLDNGVENGESTENESSGQDENENATDLEKVSDEANESSDGEAQVENSEVNEQLPKETQSPDDKSEVVVEAESKTDTPATPETPPTPSEPTEDLNPLPQSKGVGRFKKVNPVKVVEAEKSIKEMSIVDVVKHKHDYDISNAEGEVKEVMIFLDRYENQMAVGVHIDQSLGESLQRQLFKHYLKILGLPAIERGVCMEILLWKFFTDPRGAFRVSNLSRYTRTGKWIIDELQMFLQLNNLFNICKDPSERAAKLATIKLGPTVERFPAEKARYTEALTTWSTTLK